jgi:hypothetical protein
MGGAMLKTQLQWEGGQLERGNMYVVRQSILTILMSSVDSAQKMRDG